MIEFEIHNRDLLARIGKLKTKGGVIETPVFLPVINPSVKVVAPRELWEKFGCKSLMTNAYILKRHFGEEAREKGVHDILDFPGVVMTDSGAYQILAYGSVDVTNEEIVKYQEDINTDIATILDVPTGWNAPLEYAQYTVDETVRRARELEGLKRRVDISWVGPIQGGCYINLVAASAKEMGNLPFDINALGSPTPVMEQYFFEILVDMILTAKMNVPPSRPFHLFGAGHPFIFSLIVALGCDLFDSAAYSSFAREDRYMTEYGTMHLGDLQYLPCSCPVCIKYEPKDLKDMPKEHREIELSKHNLYVCFSEIKRIKQAIIEGRLWEYIEMRAHSHPSILRALKKLQKYSEYIERYSPQIKRSGLFFFGSIDLARPEVTRHKKRLEERYAPPDQAKILLLIPDFEKKDVLRRRRYKKLISYACKELGLNKNIVHVCFYGPPFGVIPLELAEIYPLYQYEYAYPSEGDVRDYVIQQILGYIHRTKYDKIVIFMEKNIWSENLAKLFHERPPERDIKLMILDA